jgi:hypothetical protein
MQRIPNNLVFFDNPDGAPMRIQSNGTGSNYRHGVACNMCDWHATGNSLLDTSEPMEEHLRDKHKIILV